MGSFEISESVIFEELKVEQTRMYPENEMQRSLQNRGLESARMSTRRTVRSFSKSTRVKGNLLWI